VTSKAAIGRICSPFISTAGSGPPNCRNSRRPMNVVKMTGPRAAGKTYYYHSITHS